MHDYWLQFTRMGRDDEMVFTTYYDLSMFTIVKHETNFFKKIYLTHDYYA